MRTSGDWLKPTFNDQPRYHKPALIYWLMNAGMAIAGDNPFGAAFAFGAGRHGDVSFRVGLGEKDVWGERRQAGGGLFVDRADSGRRVEIGDDRRDVGILFRRVSVLSMGVEQAGLSLGGGGILDGLGVFEFNERPRGTGAIGVRERGFLVVGRADFVLEKAQAEVGRAAVFGDRLALVLGDRLGDAWRILPLRLHGKTRGRPAGQRHRATLAPPGYYLLTTIAVFYPWSFLLPAALRGAWSRKARTARVRLSLGLGRRTLVHFGMRANETVSLFPTCLSGMRDLDRLDIGDGRLGCGGFQAPAVGTVRLGDIDRRGLDRDGGIRGGRVRVSLGIEMALSDVRGVGRRGDDFALDRLRNGAPRRAAWGLAATWGLILLGVGGWLAPAAEPYRVSRSRARIDRLVEPRTRADGLGDGLSTVDHL